MKIKELKKVPKNKIGRVNKNGVKSEPGEEKTGKSKLPLATMKIQLKIGFAKLPARQRILFLI